MASGPVVAKKGSYPVEVEKGKTYKWCACGLSKSQPFCDGSHKGTEFSPYTYIATDTTKVFFCGCKISQKVPFCDGSHKQLKDPTVTVV